jgi:hypothetical protein
MDTSKMSQGQMVAGAGGVLLIIALFLSWFEGLSAFDVFSGMDIIMLLIGIVAVAWAVSSGMNMSLPITAVMVGILGVVVLGFTLGTDLEADDADIGAWLALAASIAIAWGGLAGGRRPAAAPSRAASPPPPSTPAV